MIGPFILPRKRLFRPELRWEKEHGVLIVSNSGVTIHTELDVL